ncbi:hypothetical protein PACTADRAFT_51332 [Pachysolen tannophilus NRRL Y-2460]|uniref:Uncharacterized protein n=1 Tax=Pachysolen tannophilus NRRL Y-2460 TaxID=669874 RepID=A0A1E4TRY8_PACTA|nr:hypothetical protein PACTADRAFT_51332 [Pachysolen tannophilus NRRL Y-2460]
MRFQAMNSSHGGGYRKRKNGLAVARFKLFLRKNRVHLKYLIPAILIAIFLCYFILRDQSSVSPRNYIQEFINQSYDNGGTSIADLSESLISQDNTPSLIKFKSLINNPNNCPVFTYFNENDVEKLPIEEQLFEKKLLKKWVKFYYSLGVNPTILNPKEILANYKKDNDDDNDYDDDDYNNGNKDDSKLNRESDSDIEKLILKDPNSLTRDERIKQRKERRKKLIENRKKFKQKNNVKQKKALGFSFFKSQKKKPDINNKNYFINLFENQYPDLLLSNLNLKLLGLHDYLNTEGNDRIQNGIYIDYKLFPIIDNENDFVKFKQNLLKSCFHKKLAEQDIVTSDEEDFLIINKNSLKTALNSILHTKNFTNKLPASNYYTDLFGRYSIDNIKELNPALADTTNKFLFDKVLQSIDLHQHTLFLNRISTDINIIDPIALPNNLLSKNLIRIGKKMSKCPSKLIEVGYPIPENFLKVRSLKLKERWDSIKQDLKQIDNNENLYNKENLKSIEGYENVLKTLIPKCENKNLVIKSSLNMDNDFEKEERKVLQLIATPHPLTTISSLNLKDFTVKNIVSFPYRNEFLNFSVDKEQVEGENLLDMKLKIFKKILQNALTDEHSTSFFVNYDEITDPENSDNDLVLLENLNWFLGFNITHDREISEKYNARQFGNIKVINKANRKLSNILTYDAETTLSCLEEKIRTSLIFIKSYMKPRIPEPSLKKNFVSFEGEDPQTLRNRYGEIVKAYVENNNFEERQDPIIDIVEILNEYDAEIWDVIRQLNLKNRYLNKYLEEL